MMKTRMFVALSTLLLLSACGSQSDSAADYMDKAKEFYAANEFVKAKLELRNVIQIQPKNAEARYLLALINEQELDVQGTLGNLLMAVDVDPNYVDAQLKLGLYYVVGRRPEEARKTADKVLEIDPELARGHFLNARVLLLEQQPAEAMAAINRALELDPDDRDIISQAALMQARGGNPDKALEILDAGMASADEDDLLFLRQSRIGILSEMGQQEQAVTELESLAADYPDEVRYQAELAQIYLAAGEAEQAALVIDRLIAREPDNVEWRVGLARLLIRQGRAVDAEASLRSAVAEQPEALSLQLALADYLEAEGRTEEALTVYNNIVTTSASSDEGFAARNRIAVISFATDEAEAARIVQQILTESPDNSDALLLRAALSIRDNDIDSAIGDLRRVLARQPDSIRGLLGLARAQVLNGNGILAEDNYRKVLSANPTNAPAIRELAALVGNRGDVSEAEDLLRRALKIQPEDPNASRNLVKALLQQQDFASAEEEAMRMADTADASGIARYQLGIALEGQGNLTGAMQAYRESLEQDPLADPALVNLVSLMVRSGDAEGAENYLAEHVASYPDHLQARLLLAEVLGAQGRQEEAVATYRDAIEREPAVAAAYIGLAGLFPEQSNERLAAIAQGAAEIPDSSQLGLALGSTYEKRGEYEQAIAAYAAALQARDSDFIANNLAALLLDFRTDSESFQQALALAQRFERRENVYPLNLAVLGWAYYRNGDYTLASRYLERAVAQAPQLSQLRYYLGMTYARNGNPVGARQELQLAVDGAAKSGQTFTGLDEAQQELERLTPEKGAAASIAEPVSAV